MEPHEQAAEQDIIDDVVHDLSNALFAVITFAELARTSAPAGSRVAADVVEIAEAADRARASLDRLTSILR